MNTGTPATTPSTAETVLLECLNAIVSGRVETSKVHLLKKQSGQLVTRCGTERKFYGVQTGEVVTCKSCLKLQ